MLTETVLAIVFFGNGAAAATLPLLAWQADLMRRLGQIGPSPARGARADTPEAQGLHSDGAPADKLPDAPHARRPEAPAGAACGLCDSRTGEPLAEAPAEQRRGARRAGSSSDSSQCAAASEADAAAAARTAILSAAPAARVGATRSRFGERGGFGATVNGGAGLPPPRRSAAQGRLMRPALLHCRNFAQLRESCR